MRTPPSGRTSSSRWVVVWRPRPSDRTLAGPDPLVAQQGVDQRGLADAGRAQQHPGLRSREVGEEHVDALRGHSGRDVDGHAEGNGLGLGDRAVEVGREVGLVQHDDRRRAALPGGRQVALEPADAEVALVEAHDEKCHVDVGHEHLLGHVRERRLARELAPARQDDVDLPVAKADPVADDRKLSRLRGMAKPPGDLHRDVVVLGCDLPGAAVLDRDTSGLEAVVRAEFRCELVVPAELRESWVLQAVSFPARTGTASRRVGAL